MINSRQSNKSSFGSYAGGTSLGGQMLMHGNWGKLNPLKALHTMSNSISDLKSLKHTSSRNMKSTYDEDFR